MTYLNIVLRIPITVEDDNSVSCCEVDANATGSCGQQEYE